MVFEYHTCERCNTTYITHQEIVYIKKIYQMKKTIDKKFYSMFETYYRKLLRKKPERYV